MLAMIVRAACAAGMVIAAASAATAAPQKTPRPAKPITRKPLPQVGAPVQSSAAASGVTYALKDLIRAKSGEFCAPYGGEGDCIQEIEICLAMVDRDGDPVRLCVNSTPENKPEGGLKAARFRH